MEKYENQCEEEKDISTTFIGAAFVSFEKEEQVVKVVQHFARSFWRTILRKREKDEQKLFDGSTLSVI